MIRARGSLEDDTVTPCPVCRSRRREAMHCARCRADLSQYLAICTESACRRQAARDALARREVGSARQHARVALRLHATRDSRRLSVLTELLSRAEQALTSANEAPPETSTAIAAQADPASGVDPDETPPTEIPPETSRPLPCRPRAGRVAIEPPVDPTPPADPDTCWSALAELDPEPQPWWKRVLPRWWRRWRTRPAHRR